MFSFFVLRHDLPVIMATSPFNNPFSYEFERCPVIWASLSAIIVGWWRYENKSR